MHTFSSFDTVSEEVTMPTDPNHPPATRGNQSSIASPDVRNDGHPAEPADPVERADRRREAETGHDVTVERDGTVKQRPHGNMDETMVPKGKDAPDKGPSVPEHDEVDPDLSPGDDA